MAKLPSSSISSISSSSSHSPLLTLPLWRFSLPPYCQTLEEALSLPFTPRILLIEIDHYHDTYMLGLFDGYKSFSPHDESRFGTDSDGLLLYTLYCLGYLRGAQSNPDDPAYTPGLSLLSLFGLDILQSCSKQNSHLESKLNKLNKIDSINLKERENAA